MNRDSFLIFLLGIVFVTECFLVFLLYQQQRLLVMVLAKPNDVMINNYGEVKKK